jgi:hypothetical protein
MKTQQQCLVLLKLEAADRRVFFVLRQPKYDHQNGPDWTPDNDRYFYEEHSCPTNWFKDIVGVIENGDEDPHGFLEFVRAVDIPDGFDPDNPHQMPGKREGVGDTSIPAWAEIFPEVAGEGQIIDGEAVDVSRALPNM